MITIDRKGGLDPKHLVIIKVIVHGLTRLIAFIDSSAFSRVCLGRRRNVRPSFTDFPLDTLLLPLCVRSVSCLFYHLIGNGIHISLLLGICSIYRT